MYISADTKEPEHVCQRQSQLGFFVSIRTDWHIQIWASLQLVQIQVNNFVNKSNGKTSSLQFAIFKDSVTCKDIPLALFVPEVMYHLQCHGF